MEYDMEAVDRVLDELIADAIRFEEACGPLIAAGSLESAPGFERIPYGAVADADDDVIILVCPRTWDAEDTPVVPGLPREVVDAMLATRYCTLPRSVVNAVAPNLEDVPYARWTEGVPPLTPLTSHSRGRLFHRVYDQYDDVIEWLTSSRLGIHWWPERTIDHTLCTATIRQTVDCPRGGVIHRYRVRMRGQVAFRKHEPIEKPAYLALKAESVDGQGVDLSPVCFVVDPAWVNGVVQRRLVNELALVGARHIPES